MLLPTVNNMLRNDIVASPIILPTLFHIQYLTISYWMCNKVGIIGKPNRRSKFILLTVINFGRFCHGLLESKKLKWRRKTAMVHEIVA